MHRTGPSTALSIARQCELAGPAAQHVVLPAGRRDGREPGADAARSTSSICGRRFTAAASWPSVLGVNRKRVQRLMRVMGIGGDLPEAADDAARRRAQDLPVFAAECGDHAAQPGVDQRHHLRSAAARLHVPDGGDGLVQPLRAGLAVVEHAGREVSAWRRWTRRWRRAGPRSSTPIKERSSRPRRSPAGWRSAAWRSAWMAAAGRSTTCSSSGCGGA